MIIPHKPEKREANYEGFWVSKNNHRSQNNEEAHVAQSVEHILGKDEVTGSIPVVGSRLLFNNLKL